MKIENWRKVTFRLFCVFITPFFALVISLGQPLINWQQDKSNLDNSSVRFHPFEIYNYRPYDSPSELLSLRINFPDNANRESKMKSIKSINPLLLSLTLSHGSGLYALNQPEKAKRFLYANILFTDIPMVLMIGGILMNKICPEVFQGTVLTVTEYFVNLCVISFYLSIPTIRIFECRSVWKIRDASK